MGNYVIDCLSIGGNTGSFTVPYGTCTTAAGTRVKAVSNSDFVLGTGAQIVVKFSYTNTISSPQLNVNSTGAKYIRYNGANITTGYIKANKCYSFVYDGTYWNLIGDIDTDTNTTYTLTKNGSTLTLNGSDGSSTNVQIIDYGTTLPSTGENGQIFLLKA